MYVNIDMSRLALAMFGLVGWRLSTAWIDNHEHCSRFGVASTLQNSPTPPAPRPRRQQQSNDSNYSNSNKTATVIQVRFLHVVCLFFLFVCLSACVPGWVVWRFGEALLGHCALFVWGLIGLRSMTGDVVRHLGSVYFETYSAHSATASPHLRAHCSGSWKVISMLLGFMLGQSLSKLASGR